jgi:hypothetical protein
MRALQASVAPAEEHNKQQKTHEIQKEHVLRDSVAAYRDHFGHVHVAVVPCTFTHI